MKMQLLPPATDDCGLLPSLSTQPLACSEIMELPLSSKTIFSNDEEMKSDHRPVVIRFLAKFQEEEEEFSGYVCAFRFRERMWMHLFNFIVLCSRCLQVHMCKQHCKASGLWGGVANSQRASSPTPPHLLAIFLFNLLLSAIMIKCPAPVLLFQHPSFATSSLALLHVYGAWTLTSLLQGLGGQCRRIWWQAGGRGGLGRAACGSRYAGSL
jgi:hypothetical protein